MDKFTIRSEQELTNPIPESDWTPAQIFQICKTSSWDEASQLTNIAIGALKRISGAVAAYLAKGRTFPTSPKEMIDYTQGELKTFCQVWICSDHIDEVARSLGISVAKTKSIAQYLRSRGVKVNRLEGEAEEKRSSDREEFDWRKFAQVIKMAPTMEFAAKTLDMSTDDVLEKCCEVRAKGINCPIPPYDETPEWIQVRAGYELSQVVFTGSKHGSGKKYRIRHAGYRRVHKMSYGDSQYLAACFGR